MAKPTNIILTKVSLDVLDELTDVQAGQFFKAIRLYQIAAHLSQSCVSVESIQSKTDWQDSSLDTCLRKIQSLIKNSYVRLAFVAAKSQLDEQFNKTTDPARPNKTKEEIQQDLIRRQKEFYDSLIPFLDQYGKDLLRAFYNYWSQPNKSGTKMNYELQKTWDLRKRLQMWRSNERHQKQASSTEKGREIVSQKVFDEF